MSSSNSNLINNSDTNVAEPGAFETIGRRRQSRRGCVALSYENRLRELCSSKNRFRAADKGEVLRLMITFPYLASEMFPDLATEIPQSHCSSAFSGSFLVMNMELPDASLLKDFLYSRIASPVYLAIRGVVGSACIKINGKAPPYTVTMELKRNADRVSNFIPVMKDMLENNAAIQNLRVVLPDEPSVEATRDNLVQLTKLLPPNLRTLSLDRSIRLSSENSPAMTFLFGLGNRLPKQIYLRSLDITLQRPSLAESQPQLLYDNDSVESLTIMRLEVQHSGRSSDSSSYQPHNMCILNELINKMNNLTVLSLGGAWKGRFKPIRVDLTDTLVCLLQRNKIRTLKLSIEYTVRVEGDGLEDVFRRNTSLIEYADHGSTPNKTVATIAGYHALLNRHGRHVSHPAHISPVTLLSELADLNKLCFGVEKERSWTISPDLMRHSVLFGLLLENPSAWALGGEREVVKGRRKRKRAIRSP